MTDKPEPTPRASVCVEQGNYDTDEQSRRKPRAPTMQRRPRLVVETPRAFRKGTPYDDR